MKKLVILGAGGYGKTVYDVCSQQNIYEDICFLDDNAYEASGKLNDYTKFINCDIYPAFGNNELRMQWIKKLQKEGYNIPTIIHDTAYISPTVEVGMGTVVLPKSLINTDCIIKEGCIINCAAVIDHGCVIEEGCHICLGAIIKGENQIPALTKIEAGEVIPARKYKVENKR